MITVALETKYGPATATFTDNNHAHISADSLTVRGINYYVSAHVGCYGGTWQAWRDEKGRTGSIYLSRRDSIKMDDASPAARRDISAAIYGAVNAYAAEHPETLQMAHQQARHEKITRARTKVSDARKVLDAAVAELTAVLATV